MPVQRRSPLRLGDPASSQQRTQRQLTFVRLEPTRQGDADPTLALGVPRALQKQIRVATKLNGRCERDGSDTILEGRGARGRKRGNAIGERSNELPERTSGQGSIDPTVTLGQLRVVVVRAQ